MLLVNIILSKYYSWCQQCLLVPVKIKVNENKYWALRNIPRMLTRRGIIPTLIILLRTSASKLKFSSRRSVMFNKSSFSHGTNLYNFSMIPASFWKNHNLHKCTQKRFNYNMTTICHQVISRATPKQSRNLRLGSVPYAKQHNLPLGRQILLYYRDRLCNTTE